MEKQISIRLDARDLELLKTRAEQMCIPPATMVRSILLRSLRGLDSTSASEAL